MKKLILASVLCIAIFCAAIPGWAAADFSATAKVDFDASTVTVAIETPAQYGQNILVTIYPKGAALSDPTQYIRIGETFANRSGKAEIVFNLSDVALGDYTVSVTGGGYLAESCHVTTDIYFETVDDLNNVTLPAVSTATGEALNTQLIKLQRYFNVDLGTGFAESPTDFLRYFEAVRAEDYNNTLDTMGKVQATADRANLIMATLQATGRADIESLYEANDAALSFDKDDLAYSQNKADIYRIYLGLVASNRSTIQKMGDLRTMLRQSIGMAVINTKNAETVTDAIVTYGESFGIPLESYNQYCSTYGAVNMNMNFIGRNFTAPSEVLAAYNDAVKALTGRSTSSGGGALRPSGGGSRTQNVAVSGSGTSSKEETKPTANFADVASDHWAYEPIRALTAIGVLNGFEDGTFQPDASVTREQFVKMLVTAFHLTEGSAEEKSFNDVPKGHWAEPFIQKTTQLQLVSGVSETEFGLGRFLSRQDAAVLIDRTMTYLGIGSTKAEKSDFSDWNTLSDYATESVAKLCAVGIIQGMEDGCFAPQLRLTRAQAAKILYAALTVQ